MGQHGGLFGFLLSLFKAFRVFRVFRGSLPAFLLSLESLFWLSKTAPQDFFSAYCVSAVHLQGIVNAAK
jgi:hypothetical protein